MLWLTFEEIPGSSEPPITELSDNAVLELADAKMNKAQNQCLGDLQAKGKTAGLSDAERYELLALLQIYQLGQLRKSEALAEEKPSIADYAIHYLHEHFRTASPKSAAKRKKNAAVSLGSENKVHRPFRS